VSRVTWQLQRVDADQASGRTPALFERGMEDDALARFDGQPGVVLQFLLQLRRVLHAGDIGGDGVAQALLLRFERSELGVDLVFRLAGDGPPGLSPAPGTGKDRSAA